MSDMQTFPETVDEFMEHYKIIDTEQVYTNGVELVPIFRMKQWFEHLERKKGKWIRHTDWEYDGECAYECSMCGMGSDVDYDFCMRCGADMRQ